MAVTLQLAASNGLVDTEQVITVTATFVNQTSTARSVAAVVYVQRGLSTYSSAGQLVGLVIPANGSAIGTFVIAPSNENTPVWTLSENIQFRLDDNTICSMAAPQPSTLIYSGVDPALTPRPGSVATSGEAQFAEGSNSYALIPLMFSGV